MSIKYQIKKSDYLIRTRAFSSRTDILPLSTIICVSKTSRGIYNDNSPVFLNIIDAPWNPACFDLIQPEIFEKENREKFEKENRRFYAKRH
jgi:hypothetical protein